MKRFIEFITWIWEKILHSIHTAWWLIEIFGWKTIVASALLSILLAVEAVWEQLPRSLIILIGLGAFASILFIINTVFQIRDRLLRSKSSTEKPILAGGERAVTEPVDDIVGGTFDIDTTTWKTKVTFDRPFLRKPKVIVWRDDGRHREEPSVDDITPDYFWVSMKSSTLQGQWNWRAQGKLSPARRGN
jgi:hypothetical protein